MSLKTDKGKDPRLSPQTVLAYKAAPKGKRIEINDGGCPGLRLRISSAGAKTWSVVYRVAGQGEDGRSRGDPRRASLGAYPLIDLNAARELARIAMDDADRGVDYAKRLAARIAVRTDDAGRADRLSGLRAVDPRGSLARCVDGLRLRAALPRVARRARRILRPAQLRRRRQDNLGRCNARGPVPTYAALDRASPEQRLAFGFLGLTTDVLAAEAQAANA